MVRRLALPAILALALAADAAAQDAQYWTYQYGTRANLLAGAVVGSVVDISAAYYNPGALSLIDEPDLISTSKVFELSDVAFRPSNGVDASLNNLRLDVAPSFFAGLLPFHFLGNDVLAYSLFTRYLFKADIDAVRQGNLDEIDEPVQGDFFSQARFRRDLNETWVGLSYSTPLRQTVGVGLSMFVTYRSQKGFNLLSFQALSDSGETAITLGEQGYSYWNAGVLLKGGVTFDWLGWSLGLTVTTPRLDVLGEGKVLVNRTEFNPDTIFVADFQDGLPSAYRSPWSIALGGAYKRAATTINVTSEYFARVNQFVVLDPHAFVAQSTGDTISVEITQQLRDVLNFGLGVQHQLKPHFTGYASFRTDFSAKVRGAASDISLSSWDIYFVTLGAAFRIGTADLTFGLAYGWGGVDGEQLDDPLDEIGSLVPGSPTADLEYRTLRLIVAFGI